MQSILTVPVAAEATILPTSSRLVTAVLDPKIAELAFTRLSVMFAFTIEVTPAPTAIVARRSELAGVEGATGEAAGVPAIT